MSIQDQRDARRPLLGLFFVLGVGGLFAAVTALIYMSGAFMDRSSDREAWQLWLGLSTGLSAASVGVGIVFGAMRRRTARVWWFPAVLLVLPVAFVALFAQRDAKPSVVATPPLDLPLNESPRRE